MKWLLRITTAVCIAFVGTMITVVAGFILTMFSATEMGVRKFGLFGAIFFEPHTQPNGATGLEIGVVNGLPISIIFVVLMVFSVAVAIMLERLKLRKKQLTHAG
jgi:hypothetical protein